MKGSAIGPAGPRAPLSDGFAMKDLLGSSEGLNSAAWRLFPARPEFRPVAARPRMLCDRRMAPREPRALPALRGCATLPTPRGKKSIGSAAIGRRTSMFKTLTRLLCLALFALTLPLAAEAKTFYWISHGSPADPVWTYFLAGAEHVGQGHRPDRQDLVPQRRRRRPSRRRSAPRSPPRPMGSPPPAPIRAVW